MITSVPVADIDGRRAPPSVRPAEDSSGAAAAVAAFNDRDVAQTPSRGAAFLRVSDRVAVGLAAPDSTRGVQSAARSTDANIAAYEDLLGRYSAMSRGAASGMPAALMAATGNEPAAGRAAFDAYLEGRRVEAPQAAVLAAAGVARRADIGTSLADYSILLRYDDMPPTGAALLAATRMRTGADYEDMYDRYRGFRDAGKPHVAALALATAELESGGRDGLATLSAGLQAGGFSAPEAGLIAGAMLRSGQTDANNAFAYDTGLRRTEVPVQQRPALLAAGMAGRRNPGEMAAAYAWFVKHGVQPDDATLLAAGWALRGRDGAGVLASLAGARSL